MFLSRLFLIHSRIHIFRYINSCLILRFIPIHFLVPTVIGIPRRQHFQTQVRNQAVGFHLLRCYSSLLNVCALCEQMFHLSFATLTQLAVLFQKQKRDKKQSSFRDSTVFLDVCLGDRDLVQPGKGR